MIEFARRNAGVAAAVGVYGLLGTAGVMAVQQMANPVSRHPIAAPPAAGPSNTPESPPPSPAPPTSPTSTASPRPSPSFLAARHSGSGAGGSPGTSGSYSGGGGRMHPTGEPSGPKPTPTSSKCSAGRVVAVSVPVGALPCDAVTVGGSR